MAVAAGASMGQIGDVVRAASGSRLDVSIENGSGE
jgi:hypothetical protein